MATRENTDFLRFNAFAIKDLIIRKLAQDSNFSDQIYQGSNLAVLIDIVSYMFQTLMFNLNSAASESMWSDVHAYENINRLCQFLGYNPHGMNPAAAVFSVPLAQYEGQDVVIPRYSYIDTGKTDGTGKKVYYSLPEDVKIYAANTNRTAQNITLYNGRWKLFNSVFTAQGTDWETFTLNGLRSDVFTNEYVANNYIHVYVVSPTTKDDGTQEIRRYNMTDGGLFKSRNEYFSSTGNAGDSQLIPRIYSQDDYVYNLRLDETKTYTITFGNNMQGHRLEKGSTIYIFYLDSNGPGGELALGEAVGNIVTDFSGYTTTQDGVYYSNIYDKIQHIDGSSKAFRGAENVRNVSQSLLFSAEETVDQIRDFAPNWFRMGNRLVTQRDYEYYLNNSPFFRGKYADVKCMNNWGYMSTFYKWLYEMGCKYKQLNPLDTIGGRRFLQQDNVLKTSRQFADPADSNNIYLWVVPKTTDGEILSEDPSVWIADAQEMKTNLLLPIKDLTHEPYFVPGIITKFAVCAAQDYDYVRKNYIYGNKQELMKDENYVEITISDDAVYVNSTILTQVQRVIYNFFRSENFKLGQYVDFNELQNQIFAINGVNRIRTVFKPKGAINATAIRNGLCFASWTADPILTVRNRVEAIDLDISAAGRSLEAFQFPELWWNDINAINVVVIKRSAASFNTVAY